MSDIEIVKGRNRATVFSKTDAGNGWMLANTQDSVTMQQGYAVVINVEHAEDFALEVKKAGLTVEIT